MVWHKEHKTPYIFSGDTWIGYDDRYSLKLKVCHGRLLGQSIDLSLVLVEFVGGWVIVDLHRGLSLPYLQNMHT